MRAAEKRLNEMNRLGDMGHFPPLVNAGASLNVALTMVITWSSVAPRWPAELGPWIAIVLVLNLLPVILLRRTLGPRTDYPRLREMNFVHDQHKFSDWVYLAASADMAFWIALTWTAWRWSLAYQPVPRQSLYIAVVLFAFLATFSPVLIRPFRRSA
jgi:hypothetical protein